jgi:hypothetical protein
LREAYERHHVAWKDLVAWNAVPFPTVGRASTAAERQKGAPRIEEFVGLCPKLEFVLLLGRAARDGWKRANLSTPVLVPLVKPPEVAHNLKCCQRRALSSSSRGRSLGVVKPRWIRESARDRT